MSFSTIRCENNAIIFQSFAEFLDPRSVESCEYVCKSWHTLCGNNNSEFWTRMFMKQGIPFIEGHDSTMFKKDFKILHPITISGLRISQFFGEVVGRPDNIRQELFNKLNDPDPYDKNKLMKDTFVFVVDPYLIKRSTKGMILPLDSDGNLPAGIKKNGNELMIPFTLRNQIGLSLIPLEKKYGNREAFRNDLDFNIIDQCSACPNEVKVYFMRRFMVEKSQSSAYHISRTYHDQKASVREKGFGTASARVRSIFNTVSLFETGDCPDVQIGTYVRCSDTVYIGNAKHQACIGDFGYWYGAGIMADNQTYDTSGYGNSCIDFGVVPCVPAEVVKPSGLNDSLALDVSH